MWLNEAEANSEMRLNETETEISYVELESTLNVNISLISYLHPRYLFSSPEIIFDIVTPSGKFLSRKVSKLLKFIALLRMIGYALWIVLICLYFIQVNGHFHQVNCPDHESYCSLTYLYQDNCIITDQPCIISYLVTIPILIYLTLAQSVNLFLSAGIAEFDKSMGEESVCDNGIFWLLKLSGKTFLFTLFILESIALPFGTMHGHIAFAMFDSLGLEFSAIILTVVGVIVSVWGRRIKDRGEVILIILLILFPLEVVIHGVVVEIYFIIKHWDLINASLFFLAFEKDFLWYRIIRSFFSYNAILQSVTEFILRNATRALDTNLGYLATQESGFLNPVLFGIATFAFGR